MCYRCLENEIESSEPLAGGLGRPRVGTAKAPPITCRAGKLRRAGEWGGWGRISDDGPGQHNPDRSEGPWGKAARCRLHGGAPEHCGAGLRTGYTEAARCTKGGCKPHVARNSQTTGRPRLTDRP